MQSAESREGDTPILEIVYTEQKIMRVDIPRASLFVVVIVELH
jgi:hypothetical protein